jgi:hypothetical protein
MSKKTKKLLSFDDEEDDDVIVEVKSKKVKKLKKFKQNPFLINVVNEDVNDININKEEDRKYDLSSLSELKKNQNYATNEEISIDNKIIDEEGNDKNLLPKSEFMNDYNDDIELTGEDAEKLEELNESGLNLDNEHYQDILKKSNQNNYNQYVEINESNQGHGKRAKATINEIMTNNDAYSINSDNNINITRNMNNSNMDMDEEDIDNWENLMIKRSNITTAINQDKENVKINTNNINSNSITLHEMQEIVSKSINNLRQNTEIIERKLEKQGLEEGICNSKINSYREKIELEVPNLNILHELKVFISETVGMLRVKEKIINELKTSLLNTLKVFFFIDVFL